LIIQPFEKVEMLISRRLRRKSKLYSILIIRNTMLLIFEISMFSFSSKFRDHISLQAPTQIFVNRSTWLESPISYRVNSIVQTHFISLTSQSIFLPFTFISLRKILIPLTCGHSGFAVQLFQHKNHYPL
jgi:hypothetical protein